MAQRSSSRVWGTWGRRRGRPLPVRSEIGAFLQREADSPHRDVHDHTRPTSSRSCVRPP